MSIDAVKFPLESQSPDAERKSGGVSSPLPSSLLERLPQDKFPLITKHLSAREYCEFTRVSSQIRTLAAGGISGIFRHIVKESTCPGCTLIGTALRCIKYCLEQKPKNYLELLDQALEAFFHYGSQQDHSSLFVKLANWLAARNDPADLALLQTVLRKLPLTPTSLTFNTEMMGEEACKPQAITDPEEVEAVCEQIRPIITSRLETYISLIASITNLNEFIIEFSPVPASYFLCNELFYRQRLLGFLNDSPSIQHLSIGSGYNLCDIPADMVKYEESLAVVPSDLRDGVIYLCWFDVLKKLTHVKSLTLCVPLFHWRYGRDVANEDEEIIPALPFSLLNSSSVTHLKLVDSCHAGTFDNDEGFDECLEASDATERIETFSNNFRYLDLIAKEISACLGLEKLEIKWDDYLLYENVPVTKNESEKARQIDQKLENAGIVDLLKTFFTNMHENTVREVFRNYKGISDALMMLFKAYLVRYESDTPFFFSFEQYHPERNIRVTKEIEFKRPIITDSSPAGDRMIAELIEHILPEPQSDSDDDVSY